MKNLDRAVSASSIIKMIPSPVVEFKQKFPVGVIFQLPGRRWIGIGQLFLGFRIPSTFDVPLQSCS